MVTGGNQSNFIEATTDDSKYASYITIKYLQH
jgi:hypothetical protein